LFLPVVDISLINCYLTVEGKNGEPKRTVDYPQTQLLSNTSKRLRIGNDHSHQHNTTIMSNNNTTSKLPPVPSNNVLRAYACWVFREIDNNSTSATSRIEYFLAHLFSSFCPFLDRPTVKSFKVWLKQ